MKNAVYLAVFGRAGGGYRAYIPDFDKYVEADSIESAIILVREEIAKSLFDSDSAYVVPEAKALEYECGEGEFAALIDIDLVKYRHKYDNRRIRKNLTIPYWLNAEAEKQRVNFSRLLEEAVRDKLNCLETRDDID